MRLREVSEATEQMHYSHSSSRARSKSSAREYEQPAQHRVQRHHGTNYGNHCPAAGARQAVLRNDVVDKDTSTNNSHGTAGTGMGVESDRDSGLFLMSVLTSVSNVVRKNTLTDAECREAYDEVRGQET